MSLNNLKINIGLIGCGNFGLFALENFLQIKNVNIIAVTDFNQDLAIKTAEKFNTKMVKTIEELVNNSDINLVYIATPPYLHYQQSIIALKAGKNVICEKPMATDMNQAKEMYSLAKEKGLLMVTNLMQRYNPLYDLVKKLIDLKPLGEVIHGYFENYASDEQLSKEHWFWDKNKSGGIFIEHSVHFFDMFDGWLGKGQVISAQALLRPDNSDIEEQVQCTSIYENSVLINQYHGFFNSKKLDRQNIRLVFERGDITLYEWVPTSFKIDAIVNDHDQKLLSQIFPDSEVKIINNYSENEEKTLARHKSFSVNKRIEVLSKNEPIKMDLYANLLKDMLMDQIQWLENNKHQRKIREENGYQSLKIAVMAENKAHNK